MQIKIVQVKLDHALIGIVNWNEILELVAKITIEDHRCWRDHLLQKPAAQVDA